MKVYFEHDGISYYDYELVLIEQKNLTKEGFLADNNTINILEEDKIDSLLNNSFIPELGSEIHVVPGCPYAMDDVRKNYKIKRAPDSGCCNVFSPLKSYSEGLDAYAYAISTAEKKLYVISAYDSNHAYIRRIKDFLSRIGVSALDPNIIYVDMSVRNRYDHTKTFYLIKTSDSYAKLLNGELKKPCISHKKLQFACCNELTMDQIDLLYKTARMNNHGDIPNFVLQLEALNQCDWREYPRTLSLLFGEILRNVPAPVYRFVKNHLSTQKKVVKEILGMPHVNKAKTKKDWKFTKAVINHFLGVENVRFTKAATLIRKLNESGISLETFSEFYDNMIRLTPKEYNEENNDTVQ